MATTKTITLDVDTKQAVKSLKDLEHEISNIIDETNELNETNQLFKKELAALDAQYKKIPKSAMAARKQIGDQMEHLKVAIKDNNLALRDFRIKKQQKQKMISDLKHIHSKALHTTEGFAQLGTVLGGVATGMLHMAGASEETTEAFEGAVHSIETVEHVTSGAAKAQKVYQTQLKGTGIATKLLSVAQGAYAAVVGTSTGAMKLFRLALVSTGIGAAVVALGMLIANFDKVKESVENTSKSFKEGGLATKALMIAFAPLILTIKTLKAAFEGLVSMYNKALEALGMGGEKTVGNTKTLYRRLLKVGEQYREEQKAEAEKAAAETAAAEKAEYEKRLAAAKAYNEERLRIAREIQDMELSLLKDGIDKELEINKVKFERLRADVE